MINNLDRRLIIIGASGLGKEVAFAAERAGFTISGFLDDKPRTSVFYGYPILGNVDSASNYKNAQFIVAIANTKIRKEISVKLQVNDLCLSIIIDPSVTYSPSQLNIGIGSVILAGSVCTANVSIGKHTIVNKLCSIGHDVVIDNYVTLSPMCMLGGDVCIKEGVELGAQTSVRQGIVVPSYVTTGMNTTVVKSLLPGTTWIGTPAIQLKR